jgi:2-oxoglutarate/2-oxoacid ferredoxin oxidoreductase subunit alpha
VGWGGTFGAIYQAVDQVRNEGGDVSQAHLFYLNPFPKNFGSVLKRFEKVLVAELNMGHLMMLIRNQFPGTNVIGLNKVQGQPFKVHEVVKKIKEML